MPSVDWILLVLWLVPTIGILAFCVYSVRVHRPPGSVRRPLPRTHRVPAARNRSPRVPAREYAFSCIGDEPSRPAAHRVVLHLN